ncbi:MAG: hypothetical protein PHG71_06750 [Kiritimatiellae bacterium]|nr:hypothetical protein [Kiritimatiellia bacterium]
MSRYDRYRHRYERYSMFPQSKSKGERIADAEKKRKALEKKGVKLAPVVLDGFAIAKTFWGKAWCANIESYHDYANRLPRGRAYVRSNSVIDLQIESGAVRAQVMGTSLYRVTVTIKPVAKKKWAAIRAACAGKIDSLMALLRGTLSGDVMSAMTRRGEGLFPEPSEIAFTCSCPDGACLCKHVAAAMYGIGSRLDTQPELLFLLRGVDSADLIDAAAAAPAGEAVLAEGEALADSELADVFGVELAVAEPPPKPKAARRRSQKPVPEVVVPPVRRPRGRPRKTTAAPVSEPPKAKPRGRPKARKNTKT